MPPLNLTWQEEYRNMQENIDQKHNEVARLIEIENDLWIQHREKTRELGRIQMRIAAYPRGQEFMREFHVLANDEQRVTEQINDLERQLRELERDRRQLEDELDQMRREVEEFVRQNRDREQ